LTHLKVWAKKTFHLHAKKRKKDIYAFLIVHWGNRVCCRAPTSCY